MNFSLSEEEINIFELAQKFISTKCPLKSPFDSEQVRGLYREMGSLGLFGIPIPNDWGEAVERVFKLRWWLKRLVANYFPARGWKTCGPYAQLRILLSQSPVWISWLRL